MDDFVAIIFDALRDGGLNDPRALEQIYEPVGSVRFRGARNHPGVAAGAIFPVRYSGVTQADFAPLKPELSAGDPGRIRTCDLQLRRLLLYPLSYGAPMPPIVTVHVWRRRSYIESQAKTPSKLPIAAAEPPLKCRPAKLPRKWRFDYCPAA